MYGHRMKPGWYGLAADLLFPWHITLNLLNCHAHLTEGSSADSYLMCIPSLIQTAISPDLPHTHACSAKLSVHVFCSGRGEKAVVGFLWRSLVSLRTKVSGSWNPSACFLSPLTSPVGRRPYTFDCQPVLPKCWLKWPIYLMCMVGFSIQYQINVR